VMYFLAFLFDDDMRARSASYIQQSAPPVAVQAGASITPAGQYSAEQLARMKAVGSAAASSSYR